jgi:hypothetical protein
VAAESGANQPTTQRERDEEIEELKKTNYEKRRGEDSEREFGLGGTTCSRRRFLAAESGATRQPLR